MAVLTTPSVPRLPMSLRVKHLVREARAKASFYSQLYREVPQDLEDLSLTDVPIIDHGEYLASHNKRPASLLTAEQSDGIVMRTGGTTSVPKFTMYSQVELLRTSSLLASGLIHAGLRAGDRVGNLFYAGDLYGSFLLHILSVIALPIPAVQIPIGGLMAPEDTARLLKTCSVTAILSTVTSLVRLAAFCRPEGLHFDQVTTIMYGGEPIFPDQQKALAEIFPAAEIRSCIYGSMDAGVVATSARRANPAEHRVLDEAVEVEIITDTGLTNELYQPGTLVVTNLVRELMPVIRYPTGDRAEWVDREQGIFRLLGRSQSTARLGPVSVDVSHIRILAQSALASTPIEGLQLVVTRVDGKDALEIVIAASPPSPEASSRAILDLLRTERPMLQQHVDLGLIAPVTVQFVAASQLVYNSTSGKLLELIDKRTNP